MKSGLVKSGQDRSSKFGSNIKSGDRSIQFGMKSSYDRSSYVWIGYQTGQKIFGPKMHLRMEFDSGVGPTCPFLILFFYNKLNEPAAWLQKCYATICVIVFQRRIMDTLFCKSY